MTEFYTHLHKTLRRLRGIALVAAIICGLPAGVSALDLSTYAEKSRLATGTWVKIAVSSSGMHFISESSLRSWGFADPAKVKVYGYGGRRLPNLLDATYIDDLPQVPAELVAGKGVYFYAEGPTWWKSTSSQCYAPARNPFTLAGYYYLSDSGDEARLVPEPAGEGAEPADYTDSFVDHVCHEVDRESPGEAGFLLLGEDFKYTPSQNFVLPLTDAVAQDNWANMELSFVSYCKTGMSTLSLTVDGKQLPGKENIKSTSDKYSHGIELVARKEFKVSGNAAVIGINFSATATVIRANLNYISLSYLRNLRLPSDKHLVFSQTSGTVSLGGASSATRVWDVTSPLNALRMNVKVSGGKAAWSTPFVNTERSYAAWEPDGTFPSPVYVETVRNQNLHGKAVPDMVIVTPSEWRTQAERLAKFHREDKTEPLEVLVVTTQQVYNEFSSGTGDMQGIRKMLKMFYDRGNAGADTKKLRYALLFGRASYDPCLLTSKVQGLGGYPMVPSWFTDRGLNDNDSFCTDDMFGFLEDKSGINTSADKLSIAVGRIPSTSADEAKSAVDKIIDYSNRSTKSGWRNTILLTSDDDDDAVHIKDSEWMYEKLRESDRESGGMAFFKKVHIDEYERIGGIYPDARTNFYRYLDEGTVWWMYQGHGSPTSLTAEGLVTYRDLNEFYLRRVPVLYAATCDFLRWDSSTTSGAELLFKNPAGGAIAVISATRPVYIGENRYMSEAIGRHLLTRDDNGQMKTIGEIYRSAKNDYQIKGTWYANDNKLRYVLLGDPALRTVMPSYKVVLETVGDRAVTPIDSGDEPVQLMAREQTRIKGKITDAFGNIASGFNGVLSATLYDAEESVTTRGNGKEGSPYTFDRQGGRLFMGNGAVKNGEFTVEVSMPAEVADNYRPAAFSLYAYSDDGLDATGVCRDLYVYGTDPNAEPDTEAPVIEQLYLNHPNFRNGQEVNSAPMLIARVTDDRAMNLSSAGVGHQMAAYLDGGDKTYNNVSDYFTPFTDGTPGGVIHYPIENLAPGNHTLRLRVWDTGPNSAEASVDFIVAAEIAPELYDVYTDVNPVSTHANFYISHDRPDRNITVTIEVFDLMGRRMWQATETGRSDMFTSMPLTWDLLDSGGRRVPRGIYLYRATVSDQDSGEKSSTASRKLAVAGVR
ncbi:MAG: type IX secretion system sortase PorU [Muribaculaceae bacterium]|nr:type IX secretion system sortase PorU [Muribaculaceae bacterium]